MLFGQYPLYNSTFFKIKISSYVRQIFSVLYLFSSVINKFQMNLSNLCEKSIIDWIYPTFMLWACGIQIHMHRKVHFITKFKVIHWGFRTFFSLLIQLFSHIASFQQTGFLLLVIVQQQIFHSYKNLVL